MEKINVLSIIDKNEAYLVNKIIGTQAHVGKIFAETGDIEGYKKVMDYCNALISVIQDVTDDYAGDA